jgi:DNA polymerase-3 subunit epsilon
MQKVYLELTSAFRKNGGELSAERYEEIATRHTTLFEQADTIFLLLQASGYPIRETEGGGYRLETCFTPYREQRYCVIDIETNGSKPGSSQVIEIGAVMIQDGEIIDRLETFVECAFMPEYITKITGIEPSDLIGAPTRREALISLREFMKNAIFVAHNASFDYSFLTASFNRFGLGDIGNPKLCTIDLAKRTFESERYGLAYLNEFLGIETATHHRAYSDALSAFKVMEKSFETLPGYVKTADDLLQFAVSSKKQRSRKS